MRVVMYGRWQLQEAKQRFSELIRSVEADGPQFVTKHGEEVAVVVGIAEYRRSSGGEDFKIFLAICARRRARLSFVQLHLPEW